MPDHPWQHRTKRAEVLAGQYPFAAEILQFYVQVAGFQESLYHDLEAAMRARDTSAGSLPRPSQVPQLVSRFRSFLALVQKSGPASTGQIAAELQDRDNASELLDSCWLSLDGSSATPEQLLGNTLLQPYAELLRAQAAVRWDGYSLSLCPFCSRKPVAGVLRQQGDGARRSLLCGFCLAEWEFRRIVCPGCGEEDNRKLPVYTADQFDYVRVECCDTCRTYLKTVDLTKNGLAEPLVDEIASAPLDLWARQNGYAKLQSNLLGM